MMIEKSGTIRLRDIPTAAGLSPEEQELAAGMVRVTHLYRSALKVAVTQMEILDEEFARLYDHSPIHHIEYRIKTLDTGYRSLHLIVNVPIVISEGTMVLPVEIQLRTIAMDMWASLEHELRYKSDRQFTQQDAARLRLCSDAISEIDREMQDIYQGNQPQYHA